MIMRRGFTLTEVLIVLAIVAALGAIAFPITHGVLSRAHELRCRNNLGEIGYALNTYCDDHSGLLPDLLSMRKSSSANVSVLETVLAEYLPNPEVFRCPADGEFFKKSGSSYAWNHLMSDVPRESMAMLGVEAASKIPLVGDKEAFHGKEDGTMFLYGDFRTGDKVKFTTGGGALGYAKE